MNITRTWSSYDKIRWENIPEFRRKIFISFSSATEVKVLEEKVILHAFIHVNSEQNYQIHLKIYIEVLHENTHVICGGLCEAAIELI